MKTFRIQGFALLEAHGDGVGETRVALVSSEEDAQLWVSLSPSYRRHLPHDETIKVFDSLEELERGKKLEQLSKILNMLKGHEVDLLREYGLNFPMDA
jgi:hypothetical protein